MNIKQYFSLGIVAYCLLAIGLIIWFAWPKNQEVNIKKTAVASVSEEAFSSSTIKDLKDKAAKNELMQFGSIPVTVDKNMQGKADPFH